MRASRYREKNGIMPAIYEHSVTIAPEAIDRLGHVNNLVYLGWMIEAALAHSAVQGWPTDRYEKLYGRGSALAGAQLEIVVCRLRARALTPRPKLVKSKTLSKAIPKTAVRKPRQIWWSGLKKTPVYDGEKLAVGNIVKGPAIVETSDTAVVVHPGRTLRVDALGNFEITFK